MSATLAALKAQIANTETAAGARYREIVRAMADGQEPPMGEVQSVIAAANKSVDELDAEITRVRSRRRLIEKANRAPAMKVKRDELGQEVERLKEAKAKAIKEFDIKIRTAADQLHYANVEFQSCADARREAGRTADPAIMVRMDEVGSQSAAVVADIVKGEARVARLKQIESMEVPAVSSEHYEQSGNHTIDAARQERLKAHRVAKEQIENARTERVTLERELERKEALALSLDAEHTRLQQLVYEL